MISSLFRCAAQCLFAAFFFCAPLPGLGGGIYVLSDDDPVDSTGQTGQTGTNESGTNYFDTAADSDKTSNPCPEFGAEWLKAYLDKLIRNKVTSFASLNIDVIPLPGVLALSNCAFKRVTISGQSVEIKGLVISKLFIDVEDAIIDRVSTVEKERLRLVKNGSVRMAMEISENAFNSFVWEKVKNRDIISEPKVELSDGEFCLSGRSKWWIIRSSFRLAGHFEVSEENLVLFVPHKLKLSGMSAPGFLRKKLMEKINPVLDMGKFPFEIKLKTISIGENMMIISN